MAYPVKRLKYGNTFTIVDGIKFRSKREAKYYTDYKVQAWAGLITHFERQPRYKIVINGKLICTVILDFQYREADTGILHVIDVKGVDDKYSQLKRKLVEAMYPITVELVK